MFIKRTKGGSKENPFFYLQLVQSYRDKLGKPKHKVLCTLGREDELLSKQVADTIIKKFSEFSQSFILLDKDLDSIPNSYIFGPILALNSLWNTLGFDNILNDVKSKYEISFDFNMAVKLLIFNRLTDPKSKLAIHEWKQQLYSNDFQNVDLQHLYRSLDILAENKKILQKHLFEKTISLFKPEIKLAFYDLTTIYFESQEPDQLRKFGYSKDNKTDCTQVVIGLILNQDNIPLGYEVFPGNTYEGHTVKDFIDKLKNDFDIKKIIFVADKGILSKKVLEEISTSGYEYIVAAKLPNLKEEYRQKVLSKEGLVNISEGVLVSQLILEDKRLVYGYSQKRADRDKAMREELIKKLTTRLEKDPKGTVVKSVYKKYLEIGEIQIQIDETKIQGQAKWDGLFGYYTNNNELSNQEVINAYHMLWQIEESFRCMKSTLDLRPVHHWTQKRIEGHIMLCFVSFYFLRIMQKKIIESSIQKSPERFMESLKQVRAIEIISGKRKFFVRTEITDLNNKILRALKVKIPSFVLNEFVVE